MNKRKKIGWTLQANWLSSQPRQKDAIPELIKTFRAIHGIEAHNKTERKERE